VEFGGGLGRIVGGGGAVAVRVFGVGSGGPWHDEVTQGGRGGEDTVVGELVLAWVREDRNKALDEDEGVKEEGLGAVAPGGA
jgi:hypothetical protein